MALVVMFVAVLVTFSRSSWVSAIAMLVVLALLYRQYRLFTGGIIAAILLIAAIPEFRFIFMEHSEPVYQSVHRRTGHVQYHPGDAGRRVGKYVFRQLAAGRCDGVVSRMPCSVTTTSSKPHGVFRAAQCHLSGVC